MPGGNLHGEDNQRSAMALKIPSIIRFIANMRDFRARVTLTLIRNSPSGHLVRDLGLPPIIRFA